MMRLAGIFRPLIHYWTSADQISFERIVFERGKTNN